MHRSIADPGRTDIAIVPSLLVHEGRWVPGRYPELVAWLRQTHEQGALVCSACSGVLLIAETGLLTGRSATIHPAYAPTFRANFPDVRLMLDEVLVATGEREELVMAGASASWHDLVLYLVARHVGPTAAQALAKFLLAAMAHRTARDPTCRSMRRRTTAMRSSSTRRVASRQVRRGSTGDRAGRALRIAERTFKRRFARATGYSPIAYVQHVRVEEAKRRLERTSESVDAISYLVGYKDPASFRRLFKRITGVTPAAYRRKLQLPAFARTG